MQWSLGFQWLHSFWTNRNDLKTEMLLMAINQSYFSNGFKMFYETHQILDICEERTYKSVIKCYKCKLLLFIILVHAPH